MAEFKGTKGNWNIEEDIFEQPFITTEEGQIIAILTDKNDDLFYGITLEETESNAKLIASAPEMLNTINELLGLLKFHGYTNSTEIYNAQALIKKATE